jgi:hypothetical protein
MPLKRKLNWSGGGEGNVEIIMVPEGYIVTKQQITSNAARQA